MTVLFISYYECTKESRNGLSGTIIKLQFSSHLLFSSILQPTTTTINSQATRQTPTTKLWITIDNRQFKSAPASRFFTILNKNPRTLQVKSRTTTIIDIQPPPPPTTDKMPRLFLPSHYTTLGVSISSTDAEIKAAYRKRALELHPDKNQDNTEEATVLFQEVSSLPTSPPPSLHHIPSSNKHNLLTTKPARRSIWSPQQTPQARPRAPQSLCPGGKGGIGLRAMAIEELRKEGEKGVFDEAWEAWGFYRGMDKELRG